MKTVMMLAVVVLAGCGAFESSVQYDLKCVCTCPTNPSNPQQNEYTDRQCVAEDKVVQARNDFRLQSVDSYRSSFGCPEGDCACSASKTEASCF